MLNRVHLRLRRSLGVLRIWGLWVDAHSTIWLRKAIRRRGPGPLVVLGPYVYEAEWNREHNCEWD